MIRGIEFQLNTTEKDGKYVSGGVLESHLRVDPEDVRAAVMRSMSPGLQALRQNVSAIGMRTGRLRRSPGILTRKYGKSPHFRILGLVGYQHGIAPHARNVELGSPPRSGPRGVMPAFRPAWMAYFHNRQVMAANVQREIEALVQRAISRVAA